jgi:hypothetical protein
LSLVQRQGTRMKSKSIINHFIISISTVEKVVLGILTNKDANQVASQEQKGNYHQQVIHSILCALPVSCQEPQSHKHNSQNRKDDTQNSRV